MSLLLAVGAIVYGPAAPAKAAAGDIRCGSTYVYGLRAGETVSADNASLIRFTAPSGAWTKIGSFGSGTTSINALGIDAAGDLAYAMGPATNGTANMYLYRDSSGTGDAAVSLSGFNTGIGTFLAGAVDPTTGQYWVGGTASGNTFWAYSINPSTRAVTFRFNVTVPGSSNADMAFDSQGNLYLAVSPSNAVGEVRLYTADALTRTDPPGVTLSKLDASNGGYPGMAFASDGFLYLSAGTSLKKARPSTGAVEQTITTSYSTRLADLGSCATPTVVYALQKNVVSRAASTDQFTLTMTGTKVSKSATTTGTATGVQSVTAGPVLVIAGESYQMAEAASGTTNLSNYLSSYTCTGSRTGTVAGNGTSFSLTAPAADDNGKGDNITCTFTNEAKKAAIQVVKNATGTPTKAGDQVKYTFTVTNVGNRALTGIALSDPKLAPATISCPVTSLDPGKSTTCTASAAYTVLQSDVEAGKVSNTVSVVATPPNGEGAAGSVTDTDTVEVAITRTPQLKLVKTLTSGNPFVVGDKLTYAFTLTNTGNVQITGAGVDDPLLAGETCQATTLAPGASTTCSANPYSVTAADVTAGKVVNTAGVTGTSSAGAAKLDSASANQVTTKLGTVPTAGDDAATTKQNVNATINLLANDTAGVSGTGEKYTLVPSSLKFTDAGASTDGKSLTVAGQGSYTIDAAGVLTFDPLPGFSGSATAVHYQLTDSHGLTATATVKLTVTAIVPDATSDAGSTNYRTSTTIDLVANDSAGDSSAPLVPSSVVFTSASATNGGKSLSTAQGSYTINNAGVVTFVPAAGFVGTAGPVTYRIADTNQTTDTATLTITVAGPPAPTASNDSGSGLQNQDVTVDVLANDHASGTAVLDPTSVRLQGSGVSADGKTLATGNGTWRVGTDGKITFDPAASFVGASAPVTYQVADDLGQTATATVTVTIAAVVPSATNDATNVAYLHVATLSPLVNDAGNPSAALVPSSLALTDPATASGSLAVAGKGTWKVSGSQITFTPVAGFSGTVSTGYRVADANGTVATATLSVSVGTAPSATADAGTGLQNHDITVDVLANDVPGSDGAGHPGSFGPVQLGTSSGHGSYRVEADSRITFDPDPSFVGEATASYSVADSFGNPVSSTVTFTVTPVTPVAADDRGHGAFAHPVTVPVLGNDLAGDPSAPLDAFSVVLLGTGGTAGKTLVTADGSYAVDATSGAITFTPATGFTGAASPVRYRVADLNGTTTTATLTVTIGTAPNAADDFGATTQGHPVSVDALRNDTAGDDGAGTPGSLIPATLVFTAPGATDGGKTLVVAGQGTWTIGTDHQVQFVPEPSFTGTARVDYRVTDDQLNSDTATISVTIAAVTPTAADDAGHTPFQTAVTTTVIGNDAAGADDLPLVPSSVKLTDPAATGAGTRLSTGQGTWTVESDGRITFDPADGFSGLATAAYRISDRNGTSATANLTVTVGAAPQAHADATSTQQNVDAVLNVLSNDAAGDDGAGGHGTLAAASVVLTAGAATAAGKKLVVDGQGTWTVESDGRISFDPEVTFLGTAATSYRVTDSFGNTATALASVTVTPIRPQPADDQAHTTYRTAVSVDLLANDRPGADSAALVPSSVKFLAAGATENGTKLTVPGEGSYQLVDGVVTFTPAAGFQGTTSAVGYQVSDANGTSATAVLSVEVVAPAAPTAANDAVHTAFGTPVTADVLANDRAGALATLQAGSVRLSGSGVSDAGKTLVLDGVGTFSVTADGSITFTPADGFFGSVPWVSYEVSDELGRSAQASLSVRVGLPPHAFDDTATTPQNTTVGFSLLANDSAGDDGLGAAGELRPASVVFTSGSAQDEGKRLVVAGEGTWTIAADGAVSFDPLPSFVGLTSAAAYRVTDSFGNTADAVASVTVTAITPTAHDDSAHGAFGHSVVLDVIANDAPGAVSAPLESSSVIFTDAAATNDRRELSVAGEGTYRIDSSTGKVTFTPVSGFQGPTTPVEYRVSDSNLTHARALIRITSGFPPSAVDDSAHGAFGHPVVVGVLSNDTAGDDGDGELGGLVAASVVLDADAVTAAGKKLVTEDGTWTVNPTTGALTFAPAAGFSGAASVDYRVSDSFDNTATATATVTIGQAPVTVPDATVTTPQNVTVSLHPLANDVAGDDGAGAAGSIVPSSLVFTDAAASSDGKALVIDGVGRWSVATDGSLSFDPEPGYLGTTSVAYRVADSFGNTATGTASVRVTPIVPVAFDDAGHTPFRTPVIVPVADNDAPGAASAPLVPTSVRFADAAATDHGTTLATEEGTWSVRADGSVRFAPAATFTGVATVDYRIADANGTTAGAQLAVTVGQPPHAVPQAAVVTPQNITVSLDPLPNDVAGDDGAGVLGSIDAASLVLTGAGASADGKKLVRDGVGSWTVNLDGTITFDPEPGFTGDASVAYRVTDSFGNTADGTAAATVTPIRPTAVADEGHAAFAHQVSVDVVANDVAGDVSAALVPGSVRFTDAAATDAGRRLETADGVWSVDASGVVSFTPAAGFTGETSVSYRVSDTNGTSASTSVTVTVGRAPLTVPDAIVSTPQNVTVALHPLANDVAGDDGAGVAGTIVPSSVVFTDPQASADGKTLVVDGVGTWSVADDGSLSFDPEPGYLGTASVAYRVADSFGNTATGTAAVRVTPIVPVALDDAGHTPFRTPVSVLVAGNDTPGAASAPLVVASVQFPLPTATSGGTKLVTAQGAWSVNPDGSVRFVPANDFTGAATTTYQIADANGATATATIRITVGTAPVTATDHATTKQGIATSLTPATNDLPGDDGTGLVGSVDPSSLVLLNVAGDAVSSLVVAGVGTWTVSGAELHFVPVPSFTGDASVSYRVADSFGNTATGLAAVSVTPIVPVAKPDAAHAPYAHQASADVVANDVAGDVSAALVPGSVRFTDAAATDTGRRLQTAAGVWSADSSGVVSFTPAAGFTGEASVAYRVSDTNGTPASSTLTVRIGAAPFTVVQPAGSTPQGVAVVVDPLANDVAGDDGAGVVGSLVPGSVVFTSADAASDGKSLVVAGVGAWSVTADGLVRLDPEPGFVGSASVSYRVTDSFGNSTTGSASVVVAAVVPSATDDAAHTAYRTPVSVSVAGNDVAGAASAALVPTSVRFTATTATDGGKTLATAAGTWSVNTDGSVRFVPAAGFSGQAKTGYRIADVNGTTATATITITVGNPPATVSDATTVTPQNVTVGLHPLANDVPGDDGTGTLGSIDPATLRLTGQGAATDGKSLTVSGVGSWTVATDGTLSFDPEPGYLGTTSVAYRVTDSFGNTADGTAAVQVTPIVPVAHVDFGHTPFRTASLTDVAGNDQPGAASAPLVADSVRFVDSAATDGGRRLANASGVWTVDDQGRIGFVPAAGVSGKVSVGYRIADTNGTTANSTLTITVGAPPRADDDAVSTPQNENVSIFVLSDDLPGDDGFGGFGSLVVDSVMFTANHDTELTTAQGTWTVNSSGVVSFDPVPGFVGQAVTNYQVTDSFGNLSSAAITVTVTPITPSAFTDHGAGPARQAVTVAVLDNDQAGATSAPLRPGSVSIVAAAATAHGTQLLVDGQGTWTVNAGGTITFTPLADFVGTTSAISYQVADANGTTATSTVTVTVGQLSHTRPDTATIGQGTSATLAVLGNDVPGDNGGGTLGSFDPGTVCLGPDCLSSITSPGEGVWTVQPGGRVVFTPEASFIGHATLSYRVTDSFGNPVTGTVGCYVTQVVPTASDDAGHTAANTAVSVDVLANDAGGNATTPLVAGSVRLTGAGASADGLSLSIAGQGTWTAHSDGRVSFAPASGFTGATDPVSYQVSDSNGTPVSATLVITVGALPIATDNSATTLRNQPVTIDVLADDNAGDDGAGVGGTLDPASVTFTSDEATDAGRTLVVAGEGTWRADAAGQITFTPLAGFVGAATSVGYQVSDSFGNTAQARLSVVVSAVTPSAADDATTGALGHPVTLDVLANDVPGDVSAPLDPSSVTFTAAAATDAGKRLEVAGEGVWTIAADGRVTFTPESNFTGATGRVGYRVLDRNGAAAEATITVVIGAGPTAAADQVQVWQYGGVAVPVLSNDSAGAGCTLDPHSVGLTGLSISATVTRGSSELIVPSEGIWSVSADGSLAFTPNPGFGGWSSWVTYSVYDSCGNGAQAQARVYMPAANTTVEPTEDPGHGDNGGGNGGHLAYTGVEVGGLLIVAIALVLGGGLLLVLPKRRRREEDSHAA
ncbi:Ig-like domain-containing protein [Propionicimonas paludicola]|nr:tandem-95 repeat protein [Propionicimonas paludicola]